MYTQEAIEALMNRIGWADPIAPAYRNASIVLSAEVKQSESGRYFRGFHKLATVENMYDTYGEGNSEMDALNSYLLSMKREAAAKVLQAVFTLNPLANTLVATNGTLVDISGTDYTAKIVTRAAALEEAYGCQVAIDALEVIMTSVRLNDRKVKLSFDANDLRAELEGFYTEDGKQIAIGLKARYAQSVKNAIAALFPQKEKKPIIRDASYKW